MYRIGEFSKMTKTTIKTLRYYDEVNLLKPELTDRFTSYRFYTTDQLFRLHRIQSLRQIGLSVDEVKQIMNGKEVTAILEKRKMELQHEMECAKEQMSRLEFLLSGNQEDEFSGYNVILKELPACTVYSKKMRVPGYDSYFDVIPAIGAQVVKRYPDLKCTVPFYCFIVYLDNEYKEKDINIEFCESVDQMKPDFDQIKFKHMEAVMATSIMHKGPYSELSKAYCFLFRWIEENGYEIADSPRESYIDGIWNKDDEADWLTELQVPVRKKE